MKNNLKISRKEFIKSVAFLGGSSLFSSILKAYAVEPENKSKKLGQQDISEEAYDILNTVCLQCNTGCGIKVKLTDGVISKIDGNPLSPWTMTPHLGYKSSPFEITKIDGAICPKGQSGMQTAYAPYGIVRVLNRAGPRGSNKWKTISF